MFYTDRCRNIISVGWALNSWDIIFIITITSIPDCWFGLRRETRLNIFCQFLGDRQWNLYAKSDIHLLTETINKQQSKGQRQLFIKCLITARQIHACLPHKFYSLLLESEIFFKAFGQFCVQIGQPVSVKPLVSCQLFFCFLSKIFFLIIEHL